MTGYLPFTILAHLAMLIQNMSLKQIQWNKSIFQINDVGL